MQKKIKHIQPIAILVLVILGINWISNIVYKRFDLTQDKRYTLSEASLKIIDYSDSPIVIEVLLEGSFPAEFKRLQKETLQILEEFASHNKNIKYTFVDPMEGEENTSETQKQLAQLGVTPAQVSVQDGGKITQELVYPWAIISYQQRATKVSLLKNQLGTTGEERITNSVQNLEYAFADAFSKVILPKTKKVAVLKGNGQLEDRYIADFFSTLRDYYRIAAFTLDSAATNPIRTLEQIKEYDLIVSAKPTQAFTETEKYILDQYTMNGGKSLWLVDEVSIEIDSLFENGSTIAFRKDLNLTDFFFKYGVRINPAIVNDLYSAPIVLATGTESQSQYERFPWFYTPLSSSINNHAIVNNMEAVKFDYANAIDTLDNAIKKTILLSTSPITRLIGTPAEITLNEIENNLKTVNTGPNMDLFSAGELPLAVLLEGNFTSVYRNRVKPFAIPNTLDEGKESKMVIISDGDVIKNQMQGNRPIELGFDKWTNTRYGNKDFLLNTVNYLLDDIGLINIRTKEISIAFLDPQKVIQERTKWQVLNLLLPIVLLAIFGFVFNFLRKKKYT
ncbi:MAG: gliding motility-associated ABC transporter substrate-binding protein GldG [Bacteroidetes bacterium HGW-Bacteroidetes-2]|jgi:gliding-associated putative ABC transporter substrate-binding component GldG|nr:MAG: gliding motility-associated ABC transporter substrate-binding protein GldG [Bacteroidetes bacterium HGW-Bacteroidetes-2]